MLSNTAGGEMTFKAYNNILHMDWHATTIVINESRSSRGHGVMDGALVCYAGGRGLIPAVGSQQKIVYSNGVSPSRVLDLGKKNWTQTR